MNKTIHVIIALIGAVFLVVSVVGLSNSDLDTREILLVALGYGGAGLIAVGVRQFVHERRSAARS